MSNRFLLHSRFENCANIEQKRLEKAREYAIINDGEWRLKTLQCKNNEKQKQKKKRIEMENYAPLIDISNIISIP